MSKNSTCPQLDLLIQISRNLKSLIYQDKDELNGISKLARDQNSWFDFKEMERMLELVFTNYVDEKKIKSWLSAYRFNDTEVNGVVGIISAGNIPLASFQDVWCALACGIHVQLKLSAKDLSFSKFFYDKINLLIDHPHLQIEYVDKVTNIDSLIASGSNLTANHFLKFKERFPCLVRAHRNGIAILSGLETEEELIQLGLDIFSFYGLGCRNVTKVYIPEKSMIARMAQVFDTYFAYVRDNHKYNNNYEYQFAILSLNRNVFWQSETILFNESKAVHSAIAVINYEVYTSISEVISEVSENVNSIQCISTNIETISLKTSKLGRAQWPELWDYQDDVDIIQFLQNSQK